MLDHRPHGGANGDPDLPQVLRRSPVPDDFRSFTPHIGQWPIEGANHIGHGDLSRVTRESVSAHRTPLAHDDAGRAQLAQDPLHELRRDLLAGRDCLTLQQTVTAVGLGQGQQRAHPIVDLRRYVHARILPGYCGEVKQSVRLGSLIASIALLGGLSATTAHASDIKPAKRACAPNDYACLAVSTRVASPDQVVTFTGSLSPRALRNVRNWTAGEMDVCLERYRTKPGRTGWPAEQLPQACTTVKRDGTFTLNAQLGKSGTYYYGLTAGECRGDEDLCGAGDPQLVGVVGNKGDRTVTLTTR